MLGGGERGIRAKYNDMKTARASPNLLSSWGKKIARIPRKFSAEAWGKNRVVQLLSLSPGDTPAS